MIKQWTHLLTVWSGNILGLLVEVIYLNKEFNSVSSEAEYKHLPKIQLIFKIPLYYKAFQTSEKHIKSYFEHLKL